MNDATFFENKDCEYYPCHKDMAEINCLWCYCPWFYHCGSKFYRPCSECGIPHDRENYDMMIQGIENIKKEQK